MYSLEERTKAVHLYIESSCNERTVIRTLGYPSSNALRSWYKEYLCAGELHADSIPKPRCTEEQKAYAVAYFASNKTSLTQACRALGYPSRYVLRKWILEMAPTLLTKKAKPCISENTLVRYNQDQKLAAVEAMLVERIPDYKVAAQYDVCRATLYNWKRQLLGKDGISAMAKKPATTVNEESLVQENHGIDDLKAEIASLQAQIQHLQMERDALEKATELLKKPGASI